MMSKAAILDDYLELVTYGFTNPMPDADEGPWKITAKDVVGGEINFNTARKTTREAYDKKLTKKSRPEVGDILLTKDGTLGRLAIVGQEGLCINQSVAVLRPNNKILPKYLFYLLSTPNYQRQMIGDSDGSVIKHIYITRVGKMEVDIPPIDEQREKLKHLLALDKKIKLNRQTNQTLEDIAQAIFKSWFVDFEPTRAKVAAIEKRQDPERAAMAAIGGKTLDELDNLNPEQLKQLQSTAALFPDSLTNSELGEIPAEWEANAMEDIVEIGSAKRIFFKEYKKSGIPFFRGKEITKLSAGKNIIPEIFISKSRFEELSQISGVPKKNDILLTSVGTIGNTYLVQENDKFYFKDGNLTWIKKYKKDNIPYYLKTWFDSKLGNLEIENIKIGSTQQAITISAINRIVILMPSFLINKKFNEIMEINFNMRSANLAQIESLINIRDTLLPKLLSGEIDL